MASKLMTLFGGVPDWRYDMATILVAASDAASKTKSRADFVCTGTADEVKINAAIAALPAAGGAVVLSEGTFSPAGAIVPIAGMTLAGRGRGSVITPAAGFGDAAVISAATTATNANLTFRDFMFDGDNINGVHGISLTAQSTSAPVVSPRFLDLVIRNTTGTSYGILLTGARAVVASRCAFDTVGDSAIETRGVDGMLAEVCNFGPNATLQIYVQSLGSVPTRDVFIVGNRFNGSSINTTPVSGDVFGLHILCNSWRATGKNNGFYLRNVTGLEFSDNYITAEAVTDESGPLIEFVDDIVNLSMCGNNIICSLNANTYGYHAVKGTIAGGLIRGNTIYAPGRSNIGLDITGGSDVRISENTITMTGHVSDTNTIGISCAATASEIRDNTIHCATGAVPVVITGAGTRESGTRTTGTLLAASSGMTNRGTATLDGGSPSGVSVTMADILAHEVPRLTLVTKGGTGTGLYPEVTVTAGVGFALASVNGDASVWAWEI